VNAGERIPLALLVLRLSVFLVMFVWTMDKLLNPGHSAAAELLLLLAFVAGYQKRLTAGRLPAVS
jgi:hypothetical protein